MEKLVGGILIWNGKILLGKRSEHRASYPDVWDIIGGHCKGEESFEEALIRELAEEIGVVPTTYELLVHIDNRPDFLFDIYLIRNWTNPVINRCPDEHSELNWFTVAQTRQVSLADNRYISLFESIFEKVNRE